MKIKKWNIKAAKAGFAESLVKKYHVDSFVANIVAARADLIDASDLLEQKDELESPFTLKDMDKAVDRINFALDNGEQIAVYGDYDADGVTATALLYSYLEAAGAEVCYYIPERDSEGYGLNRDALLKLSDMGTRLLITVDNGISALDEIEYASSLGMDVIVTDHHKPQERLPDAVAVVNPHRKDCKSRFKQLAGVGVAFKLVAAMEGEDYQTVFEQYGELVTLGTIADVVSLTGENRTIVRLGLEQLNQSENMGITALIAQSGMEDKQLTATSIAFSLVPRINAAGRLGQAERALMLLTCEDEEEAQQLAEMISEENERRRQIENDIIEEITQQLAQSMQLAYDRVMVLCGDNWHHGVIGIVAARMTERFSKPCIVLSNQDGVATGSGRSVNGLSLFDALSACKELFTRFGGHAQAAGMTLPSDQVALFREKINRYAREHYPYMPCCTLELDGEISPTEISLDHVKALETLEPFGCDNPSPMFAIREVVIESITGMGGGKHLRIGFTKGQIRFQGIYFGLSPQCFAYIVGDKVDIAVSLQVNVYKDIESVSIRLSDIRPSGLDDTRFFKEKQLYERIISGELINQKEAKYAFPTREEIALVYRYLRQVQAYVYGEDMLYLTLKASGINYTKLLVILTALEQASLIERKDSNITVLKSEEKKDINHCEIIQYICSAIV